MSLTFRVLSGAEVEAALDDLARLRIAVFRDWPYLYDGDLDYERRYLQAYRDNAGAVLVAALDGDRIVGAATGSAMADHAAEFASAFAGSDYPLDQIFYCAESVLLPAYRGQGAGHAFFDLREARGRELGLRWSAFCAVQRPDDHPLRPASYRPLDGFWQARGYRKLTGVTTSYDWKDLDGLGESPKPMQFWIKDLTA